MLEQRSRFSERSQRAILWWGIAFAIIYGTVYMFLLDMVPLKSPTWTPQHVADWYVENQGKIKWAAVIDSWVGAFMMPILVVVVVQMARVEKGGLRIWSVLSLVSGALFSLFLVLPPIFWGVAAYSAPRSNPDITNLMHELACLTFVTGAQFYIFMWIGITVIALRPATQLVKNNPFPRWWGYTNLFMAILFEPGALAFVPRTGPFAWNGLLVFWVPLFNFFAWLVIQSWLIFRALRAQEADPEEHPAVQEHASVF